MSLARLLTQRVSVGHFSPAGTPDAYGNTAPGWTRQTTHLVRLEQTAGVEVTVGASVQTSDWVLYGPADMELGGRDRVLYAGQTYEVVGPPALQVGPRGPHHIEARLRVIQP